MESIKKCSTVVALLVSFYAGAQDHVTLLKMNDAIQTAIEQNSIINLAKLDEKIALSVYDQTEAIFLPQVNLSYTSVISNNPLNAFGFKLQQKITEQQDFDPATLNRPGSVSDQVTRLSVQQPLLNMDLQYQRKSVFKQATVYTYKTQRTKEFITWQVQQAYLQLRLSWDAAKVADEALTTAQAAYKFTKDRFEQGILPKSDLLNTQVQIKTIESDLAETKSSIVTVSDHLSVLMHMPPGLIYQPEAIFFDERNSPADTLLAFRADFKAMETALESYDLMIRGSRMSYLPRLNAFADYQLHNKNMPGSGTGAYLAGIQLSWDIFKGFQNKNKIRTQILEKKKLAEELDNQKTESRADISKTQRQLTDAAYKIDKQAAAVEQAAEALYILENRYRQGLVNTTDILQAQTQLTQKKLNYAQAVFSRNNALIYLQYLTGIRR